jgi:hypothetical protein
MFNAKVLADSVNQCGNRLITFELTYPRFIHAEFMTHRMFSRNSASSRAIPVQKMIQRVKDGPVIPIHWGKAQGGMQAYEELGQPQKDYCIESWVAARDNAIAVVEELLKQGLHKQIANRLLEPWMWITVIASTTNLANFKALRCHHAAEPHFQKLAGLMMEAAINSKPVELFEGEWHTPFIDQDDVTYNVQNNRDPKELLKISVGRCARVSYLTHDGKRDHNEDIALHDKLMASEPLHASPAEHVAQALAEPKRIGNFCGWHQYRKMFANEYIREVGEV